MPKPKVSVVIPTFNRSRFIQRAIQSVERQTYLDLEIIVCDDGSTDDTVDVVKAMQTNSCFPIRLEILPRNLGVSAARNWAIFKAQGELIAFLDSDDTWKPEKLKKQVDFLEANTRFVGVGCNIEVFWEDGSRNPVFGQPPDLDEHNELFKLIYQCYITTSCFLVRKDALILAGLFDLRLRSSEDRDLWWRLPKFGRIGFLNEPMTNYIVHGTRLSTILSKATAKTYIPAVMRTLWYWRDELTKEQARQILSMVHLMVATDASASGMKLSCIRHALTTFYYGYQRIAAVKKITTSLVSFLLRR